MIAVTKWTAACGLLFCLSAGGCKVTSQAEASAPPPAISLSPSAAGAKCGGKGQPDCPLQSWMKSTLQTYQREKNYERLEASLTKLASHAPDGYASWKELSEAGALAAKNGDETAVSKSCKACHNEHRARYREERREKHLF